MIRIAADLGGADRPQQELIEGAVRAVRELDDLYLYVTGDAKALSPCVEGVERLELVDAPEVITNSEDPTEAFKNKKNSTLIRALELCKSDADIGGFVSCGPTGAIFVASMMLLGRIARVSPMLLVELKRADGTPICIVDCGANVDCRAEKLVDFARMGTAYMKAVGIADPVTALLSNGAEDKKGSEVVKKANALLRESGLNFSGNTEANGILEGSADVIVCDGFSGNVLLKSIEGSGKAVIAEWRRLAAEAGIKDSASEQIMQRLYQKYDHNTQGGAVLLGTRLPVIKGHGAATSETVCNIIKSACKLAANGLTDKIRQEFN
ncbi:MAG: phosphate acyltransferase [Ruminococcus sp.]|nr:phosphate acyltransferase [Ruminococcus sp.]